MTIPGGYRPPPVPGWIPPVPPPPRFAAAAAAAAATAMSDKLAAAAADEMPTKKVSLISIRFHLREGERRMLYNWFTSSTDFQAVHYYEYVCLCRQSALHRLNFQQKLFRVRIFQHKFRRIILFRFSLCQPLNLLLILILNGF